jgi:hypothetical protein
MTVPTSTVSVAVRPSFSLRKQNRGQHTLWHAYASRAHLRTSMLAKHEHFIIMEAACPIFIGSLNVTQSSTANDSIVGLLPVTLACSKTPMFPTTAFSTSSGLVLSITPRVKSGTSHLPQLFHALHSQLRVSPSHPQLDTSRYTPPSPPPKIPHTWFTFGRSIGMFGHVQVGRSMLPTLQLGGVSVFHSSQLRRLCSSGPSSCPSRILPLL